MITRIAWLRRRLPLATAIALALVLRVFVVESFAVDGDSMRPSFADGDRVVVEKLAAPGRGDVIVLRSQGLTLIKRVVAVAGDTIEVRGCRAVVNGTVAAEPGVDRSHTRRDPSCRMPRVRVPAGTVFVMGDNRDDSLDSRAFGPVPLDDVIGHVVGVVWPPTHLEGV
jgi:signal peptidase I